MTATPELPFIGAGVVALVGGVKREGKFPEKGVIAVVGVVLLVLVTSATANTRIAPVVHAFGILTLIGAVFGTVRIFQQPQKQKGLK